MFSFAAVKSTREALSVATMDAVTIAAALRGISTLRSTVLALAVVAAVLVLVLAVSHAMSRSGGRRTGAATSRGSSSLETQFVFEGGDMCVPGGGAGV